jgi:alpha-ketoglutarate-dependent 2,4-dichlorophenoxyacetate dioxygenase
MSCPSLIAGTGGGMTLQVRRLGETFCGEVSGVDIAAGVTPGQIEQIKRFLSQYPVICFRDQHHDAEQQERFASSFGPLMVNQYPELGGLKDGSRKHIEFGTLDENGNPVDPASRRALMAAANALWHSDGAHFNVPNRYTMLTALVLPSNPPDTEYVDMRQAWDDLPKARKGELEGLMVEHSIVVSRARMGLKVEDFISQETLRLHEPAVQPLVRTDPISGRKSLYLSSHASHIVGWPEEKGRALVEELYRFAAQPERRYAHKWRPHDVIMWDNFATMHRATEYQGSEPRVMRWSGILHQSRAA